MKYYDDKELTNYICKNYSHLFTDVEKQIFTTIFAEQKAKGTNNKKLAQKIIDKWASSDDQIIKEALANGVDSFRESVKNRIVKKENNIIINRCPNCQRITKTPKAKQCPWCYHRWHSKK